MPNKKIFIAEDDPGILDLLRIRLDVAGYSTNYARDGLDAISAITTNPPDAIILDIGLPTRNGFEVLRAIRANMRTQNIPVLMLTARHDSSDVQQAIADGAQDYLAKPFDDQKLLVRIDRLLKIRAAAQAQPAQAVHRL